MVGRGPPIGARPTAAVRGAGSSHRRRGSRAFTSDSGFVVSGAIGSGCPGARVAARAKGVRVPGVAARAKDVPVRSAASWHRRFAWRSPIAAPFPVRAPTPSGRPRWFPRSPGAGPDLRRKAAPAPTGGHPGPQRREPGARRRGSGARPQWLRQWGSGRALARRCPLAAERTRPLSAGPASSPHHETSHIGHQGDTLGHNPETRTSESAPILARSALGPSPRPGLSPLPHVSAPRWYNAPASANRAGSSPR
ncbi:hypothetical protein F4561_004318 [Lipingzhangella halophila]|uniref:Uncharacterized protein n=1 Tax=Lipingzhangella halophila TaxID=1783352 RepID=A0A7W7RK45_9ACTN|nr:hypothetical protein [Lipingzhangella halophila]